MIFDFYFVSNIIVWLCSWTLISSVIVDFLLYQDNKNTQKKKKSKVATWNMSLFFFFLYILWWTKIWKFNIESEFIIFINILWLSIVVISTFFNVVWRFYLSSNWANHIKIYDNHFLVNSWPYKIVRHPLYASLIWLWIWVWLVYSNYLMLILTLLIFLPMMIYRAKQEEELLEKKFNNYKEYKEKVWMFLPKLF